MTRAMRMRASCSLLALVSALISAPILAPILIVSAAPVWAAGTDPAAAAPAPGESTAGASAQSPAAQNALPQNAASQNASGANASSPATAAEAPAASQPSQASQSQPAGANPAASSPPSAGDGSPQQTGAAAPPAPPSPLQTALDAFQAAKPSKGRETNAERKRRDEIASFYAGRAYAPIWIDHDAWTPAAQAAVARLKQADDDGLDAAALNIPTLSVGASDSDRLATELALSEAVVVYGEQASGGRVDPHRVVKQIAPADDRMTPADILGKLASASDASAVLDGFNPPQAGYRALRAKLVELRSGNNGAVAMNPPVAKFSGKFSAKSLRTNISDVRSSRRDRAVEDDIIANMEMWRWLPRDLGQDRIEVNIADYSLTMFHGDDIVRHARVIVGKATTPTPLFSNSVKFIVVNPSWDIPESIVEKEILPKLAANPNYLQQAGYVAVRKNGVLHVRQPPGDRNALGRIKFLFPNDYAVYLHDTPDRNLFASGRRALSHGCVRVQDPFALGENVLGAANGWSEARLKKLMVGDKEHTIRMPEPLPIHIEYFTAFVDPAGRLQTRDDVYGYTHKIQSALKILG